MINSSKPHTNEGRKIADWELDFYSRPILESDGKKRWELLITSTQDFSEEQTFKYEKRCPANEVNSIWLSKSLEEALNKANDQGWDPPKRIRCSRPSMKTMVKKASEKVGIQVIESRRTFSLFEWLSQREREIYPNEPGYISGPLPPNSPSLVNQPEPLPEALRGDAWSFSSLQVGMVREAKEWPMEFNSLLPINNSIEDEIFIHGLRLFSKSRALALSAWLSGLEPVRLVVENNQLILEAGQEDRWLVTDLGKDYAEEMKSNLNNAKRNADGLQFIAIQSSPDVEILTGFWMLKDID